MCGINGVIGLKPGYRPDQDEILTMRDSMLHRGPDDAGFFLKNNIGLGHRRLTIIDLSANGHQPMSDADETVWIVYNGEFYNYQDYIDEVKQKGYKLKSTSDTEIIIYLYKIYGIEGLLKRMNGMFAFCLLDLKQNFCYIVRDRFGVKPLYYTVNASRIAFASEIKAFYHLKDYTPQINYDAIPEYFLFQKLLDYSTLLKDTYEVKPGTYLKIQNDKIIETKYYDLIDTGENKNISEGEAVEEFDRLISLAVKRQMVSDVPVGVALSGGLDSSLIALKMAELSSEPIHTISIGYKEKNANEFVHSRFIANMIKSDHKEILDNSDQFLGLLPYVTYMYDTPPANGVPVFRAAKYASEVCKVVLNGQGCDELFGGYTGYKYALWQSKINQNSQTLFGKKVFENLSNKHLIGVQKGKLFRKVFKRLPLEGVTIAAAYASVIPQDDFVNSIKQADQNDYFRLLEKYSLLWPNSSNRDFFYKMLYAEMQRSLQLNLNDTDKMSMAASVETRVPFLDHELVEFVFSLPSRFKLNNGISKYLQKKMMLKYFSKEFVHRKKEGFPVPITNWFIEKEVQLIRDDRTQIDNRFNVEYFKSYEELVRTGHLGINKDAVAPLMRYYGLKLWEETIGMKSYPSQDIQQHYKMKLCFISSDRYSFFIDTANYFANHNHEVHVFCSKRPVNLHQKIIFHNDMLGKMDADVNKSNILLIPLHASRLRKKIAQIKPDIVHVFNLKWSGWLTALSNIHPFILSTIGSDILREQNAESNFVVRALKKLTINKTDYITVVSKQMLDRVKEINSTVKVDFFIPGADPDIFKAGEPSKELEQKLSKQKNKIIFSARGIRPIYQTKEIISAFAELKKKFSNLVLISGGAEKTEYAEETRQMVKDLGLSDSVLFTGFAEMNDWVDYYRACDVVVSFPFNDGMPATIFEAMIMEKPVVLSNIPSTNEICTNDIDAVICEKNDVNSLVNSLEKILTNEELSKKIVINAKKTYNEKGNAVTYLKHLNDVYKQICCLSN